MKSHFRSAVRFLLGMTLTAAVGVGSAQTPAQMEYERQQREYWRQQEQQRQEQQRQQQQMNENARVQQEQSRRFMESTKPSGSYAPGAAQGSPGAGPGGGADPTGAQAASAARAMWEKRPALPPDRNPLLGKWTRPASTRTNSSDPFAALAAMAKGGLCEVLFGGGVFEFRPDRLMGMDERTPAQELDRVEYRGDAKRVVVLPKTTIKLIEFDFEGPDRINWASQKCVLVRVGAASNSASAAKPATIVSAAAAPSASSDSTTGGVLAFSVGAPSADNKVAGRTLWVLKQDAQVALIRGGLKSTPYATVLQNWMRACAEKTPDCEKGIRALQAFSVGYVTTDANGHAQAPLPAGRYWVLSDAKVGGKRMMWHELVDVKAGNQSLTLDQRNAMPVE